MSENESLGLTVVRGSLVTLLSASINKLLSLLFYFSILRFVAKEQAGLFFIGLAILGFVTLIPSFGIPASVSRYIPYYIGKKEEEKIKPLVKKLGSLVILISLVTSGIIIGFARQIASFYGVEGVEPIIIVTALIAPFALLYPFITSFLRGVGRFSLAAVTDSFHFFLKLSLLLAFIFLVSSSAQYLMTSLLITFALTCGLGLFFLFNELKKFKQTCDVSYAELKEVVGYGIPIYLAGFGILISNWTDTLFLGYFIGPAVVAGYNAVLLITRNIGPVISNTLSGVIRPIMSKLYGEKSENLRVLGVYALKWYLALGLPVLVAFLDFPQQLMSIIFPKYVEYYWLIYILGPTFFTALISRPFADALAAVGRTDIFLKVSALILFPNIILNWLLIPMYGVLGAAIATSVSFVSAQALYIYYGKKITGVTVKRDLWKPCVAALISFISVYLLTPILSADLTGLVIGGVVAGSVYLLILLLTGFIENKEVEIVKSFIQTIHSK